MTKNSIFALSGALFLTLCPGTAAFGADENAKFNLTCQFEESEPLDGFTITFSVDTEKNEFWEGIAPALITEFTDARLRAEHNLGGTVWALVEPSLRGLSIVMQYSLDRKSMLLTRETIARTPEGDNVEDSYQGTCRVAPWSDPTDH